MTFLGPQQLSIPKEGIPKKMGGLSIIAVDPGGVTGWSLICLPYNSFEHDLPWILENKLLWVHGQIDCKKDLDAGVFWLRKLVDGWPSAAIVFESFFIRQMAVDLAPIEVISVVRHHLWMRQRKMHMQQPSMAKRLDNDRLKLLGVYTSDGGLQHARDADRHALMVIRRCLDKNGSKLRKELWQASSPE